MKVNRNFHGFTLIETVVVLGILATLFGIVIINLLGGRERASKATSVDTFMSDARSQQLKAMLGDTEGRVTSDAYGVFFDSASYTLFHGASYTPADPANFVVSLGNNIVVNNATFPNSQIVFASGSGEIAGFSQGQNEVTLLNTTNNSQTTIRFNRFGAIIYAQ